MNSGQMQLSGLGFAELTYIVEANTGLNSTNWISLGNTTANGFGALNFVDVQATNFPGRFYRFKLQ